MIDTSIKPLSAAYPSSTAEASKSDSAQKLANLSRTEMGKSQATSNASDQGLHLDLEGMDKVAKEMERLFAPPNTVYEYTVDKDTNKLIFRVLDKDTRKVIKQIPPEELLEFSKRLQEYMDGKLLSVKA